MQEKIEDLIRKRVGMKYWLESGDMIFKPLAAEIAKLFERKVIWEGGGQARHYTYKTVIDMVHTDVPLYLKTKLDCRDGQPVRVIVEEIDESE